MASPEDELEFYYVQAPAFEGFFGNLFKTLGGFHCAFGVINKSTGKNYTIEYDAESEVLNATLPIIGKNPDNTTKLEWYKGGGVCVQPGLNATYYHSGFQHVTTVNGTIFNEFLKWTVKDNATYPEYELFYVYDSWNGPTNSVSYVNSSTCYDFNWRGMDWLYRNGAKLNYSEPMLHDYIVLLSAKPTPVNYSDPVWHDQINKFYEAFHLHLNDPWEDWILFLEDLLLGNKFLYAYGQYYVLEPMHYPYVHKSYSPQPLPGQPSNATKPALAPRKSHVHIN